MAGHPCTRAICDPTTADGAKQCAAKADWIVEGTVDELMVHHGLLCESIGCTSARTGSVVTLATSGLKVVKGVVKNRGTLAPPNRQDSYGSSSHCFGRFVEIEPAMIGQRVRLFGTDKSLGSNTGPGYFAFEPVFQ